MFYSTSWTSDPRFQPSFHAMNAVYPGVYPYSSQNGQTNCIPYVQPSVPFKSEKAASFPGKDAVYRFLNHSGYAWRRFLTLLSTVTAKKVQELTGADRVSVFVVDDSMFERNRSKTVELISRFKDHATGCYYKGFRILTLGWSDGHTFIPVDFSLLASLKSQVNGIMEGIDKRTSGIKKNE